ncbi:MAG: hypothetical protein A2756_05580 [Candidatus Ryanbacteria bacterium RIFCSPHIGHO2_01_FULL_48_27]|uniref:histidine kinase n=1 Tax=Candidatus Ryanbacteria bacterium RIFCSPHIGHO2_01_FULL_48_27 TaxID=1802115 RepID=A0A1G2G2X6_9BACT|nr:MAG: hypothetical protein A2756_05580 [Candidatus Ryanbacteria bacterium RIFCSPHIGHO2_01_FULL_48_27]
MSPTTQTSSFWQKLNLVDQCKQYRVSLLACPHFLFLVMGFVMIVAMVGTNIVAQRYGDPEIVIFSVSGVTMILFIISHVVVRSFERIALASKAKAEFVSIISHQLRSPLTSIKWLIETLVKDSGKIDEQSKPYLKTVNDYNERMIRLVNDLLEVNRIEDDRMTLRLTENSIVDITKKTIEDYKQFAATSNITLVPEIDESVPKAVFDETRLRWVIENLVNNAIRYGRANTPVTVKISHDKDSIHWSATNQGIGISKEDGKRIFEKFFRGNNSVKLQTEGSGLGLFIARSIVEASGGKIGFSSEENKETTFWFTLPVNNPKKSIQH